jgi:hypothetical protein
VAANLYCQKSGYEKAMSFSTKPADDTTIYPQSGGFCDPDVDDCESISQVVCQKQAAAPESQPGGGSGGMTGLNQLGGQIQGELATAAFTDKGKPRVAVFGRGTDNALWWQAGDSKGTWYGWAKIGGQMKYSPACDALNGKVYCAVVGLDNAVWVTSQSDASVSKWAGFKSIGGKTKFSPAVVRGWDEVGNDAIFVVVRGLDGNLGYSTYSVEVDEDNPNGIGTWTKFQNTQEPVGSAMACGSLSDGSTYCLSRDATDGSVEAVMDVSGNPQAVSLGGQTDKRPGILRGSKDGIVRALVRGMDGKMWVNRRLKNGKWTGWSGTKYAFTGQPACHSVSSTATNWCFAVVQDGSVVSQNFPATAFGGP